MTRMLLIRHGQSEANKLNIFTGQSDFALTELGQRQAELTADFIAQNYKVDAVYASDLVRAMDTGRATARRFGLDVIPEKGFRELYLGDWEGVVYEKVWSGSPEMKTLWETNIGSVVCPTGESTVQLQARAIDALRRIAAAHPDKTVAVASHACCIRSIVAYCLGGSTECMKDIPWYANASVTVIETDGTHFALVQADINDHLADLATRFTNI